MSPVVAVSDPPSAPDPADGTQLAWTLQQHTQDAVRRHAFIVSLSWGRFPPGFWQASGVHQVQVLRMNSLVSVFFFKESFAPSSHLKK